MFVHRSNRTECLVDALVDVLATPAASWNTPELVAVQGKGVDRWLAQQLANRMGIWALPAFPFPRALIDTVLDATLGTSEDAAGYEPDQLRWSIASMLPELLPHDDFATLEHYLAQRGGGDSALLSLADAIARTFDRYLVFRPELILRWERSNDPESAPLRWQRHLWRQLRTQLGDHHLAARARAFKQATQASEPRPTAGVLPSRICLFGFSSLPPLYIDLLANAAEQTEIHLFVLSPSPEWFVETQHPLIHTLGRLGRDFLDLLAEQVNDVTEADHFVSAHPPTQLGHLQRDLFELQVREPALPAPDCDSFSVHACHGPLREAEVLHDLLLQAFNDSPGLKPEDVCVLCPDLERYDPTVRAVFDKEGVLPVGAPDHAGEQRPAVEAAAKRVLAFLLGRADVQSLLDMISDPLTMERWQITQEDLAHIRRYLAASEVRWGWDSEHRARLGHPRLTTHTWHDALDRIALGFATRRPTHLGTVTTVPVSSSEDAFMWGKLLAPLEQLQRLAQQCGTPKPLAGWQGLLSEAVGTVLPTTVLKSEAARGLREALTAIAGLAANARFTGEVSFPAIAEEVTRLLQRAQHRSASFAGGITIAELSHVRAVPFRVVALVGMNEGAFPRSDTLTGFDIMREQQRRGDRDGRKEDRQVFLELLLSTRDKLIVTYTGQDPVDGAKLPPSSVVSDLLRVQENMYTRGMEERSRPSSPQEHGLHPFSERYLRQSDQPFFTFSGFAEEASRQCMQPRVDEQPFADVTLPSTLSNEALPLGALLSFFRNPSRGYAQALSVDLADRLVTLESRDTTELTPLKRFRLQDLLLQASLAGQQSSEMMATVRDAGWLPPGALGSHWGVQLERFCRELTQASAPLLEREVLPAVEIDLNCGNTHLVGLLTGLGPSGLLEVQPGRVTAARELDLWIRHTSLCAMHPNQSFESVLFGRSDTPKGKLGAAVDVVSFRTVEEPVAVLSDLIGLYRAGLRRPLPLFPQAARNYAQYKRTAPAASALARVRAEAEASQKRGVDLLGGANAGRLFWPPDPFAFDAWEQDDIGWASFTNCAELVYAPLLRHLQTPENPTLEER